jgi:hypothetical protein
LLTRVPFNLKETYSQHWKKQIKYMDDMNLDDMFGADEFTKVKTEAKAGFAVNKEDYDIDQSKKQDIFTSKG